MNSRDTDQPIPRIQFKVGRSLHREISDENYSGEAAETRLEASWWQPVTWGAALLSITLIALTSGPVWLLLLGPFAFIGLVRAMKIRSLWY